MELNPGNRTSDKPSWIGPVLIIHGVGNPDRGEIRDAVVGNLASAGFDTAAVEEFNWNEVVQHPIQTNRFPPSILWETARSLAIASVACPSTPGQSDLSRSEAFILRLQEFVFCTAEVALAAALAIVLVVGPFLLAALEWGNTIGVETVNPYGPIVRTSVGFAALSLASLVVFGALSCSSAFLQNSTIPLWIALRRTAIVCLRPLVLVCLTPFIFPWGWLAPYVKELLRRLWWLFLVICPPIGAGGIFLILLFAEPGKAKFFPILGAAYGGAGAYCFALVLVIAMAHVTANLVGPFVKISLDVFRYVGDPSYRRALQDFLQEHLNKIRPKSIDGVHTTIVAHSLGSVIAIDSLVSSKTWTKQDAVTLVTLGSPLHRFLYRFFPGFMFPRSADECARSIRGRLRAFRWLNVYRPWDYVGTRLHITESESTLETHTGQWRRIISSHPGYWDDPVVRKKVVKELANLEFSKRQRAEFSDCREPSLRSSVHRKAMIRVLRIAILAGIVAAPAVNTATLIARRVGTDQENARLLDEALSSGESTLAVVTHSNNVVADFVRHDIYWFSYADREGRPYEKEIVVRSDVPFDDLLFDHAALRRYVYESCEAETNSPGPRRCTRRGVPLRHHAVDHSVFCLPDFLPIQTWWHSTANWSVALVSLAALYAMIFAAVRFLVLPWITALIGEELV